MSLKKLKIIIFGDTNVGKTALLNQYVNNEFIDQMETTIGTDFKEKNIVINNQEVKLNLYDTAGQERFRSIVVSFFRGVNGGIIVFDITNYSTFESIQGWVDEYQKYNDNPNLIIVGNKLDLKDKRQVPLETVEKFAKELNIPYFETSAKYNENVEYAFNEIANIALQQTSLFSENNLMNPEAKNCSC